MGPSHLLAEVPFGESGCYEAFIRSWLYVIIRKSKQSTFVFLGQHSINAIREILMKYSLKDFCTWWQILLHCTTEIWSTQHLACLLWLKQTLFLLLCYYDSPKQPSLLFTTMSSKENLGILPNGLWYSSTEMWIIQTRDFQTHQNKERKTERDRQRSHHKTLKTEFCGWSSRRSLANSIPWAGKPKTVSYHNTSSVAKLTS